MVQWKLAVVKLGKTSFVLKSYEWISKHHLCFLPSLDSLMMGMADLTECLLVWVLLGVVHSGRHSGSLSESTAVFLIPPLAEFCSLVLMDTINIKIRRRHTLRGARWEGGRGRERKESKLVACLLIFVKSHLLVLVDRKWISCRP